MKMRTPTLAAVVSLLCLVPLVAQEPAPEPAPRPVPRPEPRPGRPAVPLKVQVTLSRFEGDKRASSLPYSLLVNASDRMWGERTSLRMGIEVPVRVGTPPADKEGKLGPGSYQYRNVGTKIDCRANGMEDGRYLLDVTVEQSSLNSPADRSAANIPDLPLFRSFNSSFTAALRDGQSATTVAATDPVSGESVRIELSLIVVR